MEKRVTYRVFPHLLKCNVHTLLQLHHFIFNVLARCSARRFSVYWGGFRKVLRVRKVSSGKEQLPNSTKTWTYKKLNTWQQERADLLWLLIFYLKKKNEIENCTGPLIKAAAHTKLNGTSQLLAGQESGPFLHFGARIWDFLFIFTMLLWLHSFWRSALKCSGSQQEYDLVSSCTAPPTEKTKAAASGQRKMRMKMRRRKKCVVPRSHTHI